MDDALIAVKSAADRAVTGSAGTGSAQRCSQTGAIVMRAIGLGGFCLLLLALVAGCQSSPQSNPSIWDAIDSTRAFYATNILQEGDVISVEFENATNLNTVQKIALDGMLNLQFIGRVKAVGKTPQELQTELVALYKPQVKVDMVTVRVISTAASIYVTGAVLRPGKIPLDRPTTILQALVEAGGVDYSRAKISEVTVFRVEDDMQRSYRINLKDTLKGKNVSVFYMKPFDIIYVATKTFNF